MGRLIAKLVVFCIVFLALMRLIGNADHLDREQSANPNVNRIVYAPQFDSLDILFAGSSAVYSGVVPAQFDSVGLRTYNLGVAAAGPYFCQLLVDDYLKAVHQKPKAVFFLYVSSTFMEHADDFEEIGIHRYLHHPYSNEYVANKYHQWSSYPYLLLKSFQKGVRNIVYREKGNKAMIEQLVSDKGFYRSDETTSAEKEKREYASFAGYRKAVFNQSKLDYLMRYADSLQRQGIHVAFFSVPGNRMNGFFSEAFMQSFNKGKVRLQSLFPFIDAAAVPMDSSCFRNSDHLNTKGARITTDAIVRAVLSDKDMRQWFGAGIPIKTISLQKN